MPLIVYPVLCLVFQRSLFTSFAPSAQQMVVIGVPDDVMGEALQQAVAAGQRILKTKEDTTEKNAKDRNAKGDTPEASSPQEKNVANDVLQNFSASIQQNLSTPKVRLVVAEELQQQIEDRDVDLGVIVHQSQESSRFKKFADFELIYLDSSPLGQLAVQYVSERLDAVNQSYIDAMLVKSTGSQDLPATTTLSPIKQSVADRFSLTTLIPLVLILMTVTGAVYPAIDSTAGERERGTLEMVMAAPVPRMQMLVAKYVAVMCVALLTALANLVAMTVTLYATGLGGYIFGREGVSSLLIVQVFFLLILFAAFFSAVLLALTSFARSFKEAQAYLIPLMLISLAPGVMSLMPNIKLQGILAVTPLINMVLLARDMFEGQSNPFVTGVVIVSTILYATAALSIAARIFGSDAVLYGSQASWSDLFRAPSHARSAATISDALFCLAMLFPLFFLTSGAVGMMQNYPLSVRLAMSGCATAAIFGGVPWLIARRQRLRLKDCFNWHPPKYLATIGAAILGFCLWPLAHELVLLNQKLGIATLSADQLQGAEKLIDSFKTVPAIVILAAMAVSPAVFEELFFRGYLFSALATKLNARNTILISALLFGLFHVVTAGALGTQRFVPSTFLGIVLGWVCWRTGSVLPGIVLHTCHNGLVLMLGYYHEELLARGWGVQEQEHVPITWALTAVGVGTLGVVLIWLGRRRR